MDINGGDKNRVFLHDLIKITEGTVSEGTIFMHVKKRHLEKFVKPKQYECRMKISQRPKIPHRFGNS